MATMPSMSRELDDRLLPKRKFRIATLTGLRAAEWSAV